MELKDTVSWTFLISSLDFALNVITLSHRRRFPLTPSIRKTNKETNPLVEVLMNQNSQEFVFPILLRLEVYLENNGDLSEKVLIQIPSNFNCQRLLFDTNDFVCEQKIFYLCPSLHFKKFFNSIILNIIYINWFSFVQLQKTNCWKKILKYFSLLT